MSIYESLSSNLSKQIEEDLQNGIYLSPFRAKEEDAIRRIDKEHDLPTVWRGPFVRDCDKILHSTYYNRLSDKTQVFSLYKNDDITRRSLHVQLVSRIARTIGKTLGLNLELIEAISLGHDLGHTPFGHAGEKALDNLLFAKCGLHFSHSIQSVRVMDVLFPANLTLQTLNGFAAHNGEMELDIYRPAPLTGNKTADFLSFDQKVLASQKDLAENLTWVPCTLEGCLMRICDIIAYLGKDRQDGAKTMKDASFEVFNDSLLGATNSEIINNLSVNIIENSYGKPYIAMDQAHFDALSEAKRNNYSYIYKTEVVEKQMKEEILPLMEPLFNKLLQDIEAGDENSIAFRHHILKVEQNHYRSTSSQTLYRETPAALIAADFIASMTDDYFLDLYNYLFPEKAHSIHFHGYFNS